MLIQAVKRLTLCLSAEQGQEKVISATPYSAAWPREEKKECLFQQRMAKERILNKKSKQTAYSKYFAGLKVAELALKCLKASFTQNIYAQTGLLFGGYYDKELGLKESMKVR